MSGLSVNQDTFRMNLAVPDDIVGMPTADDSGWAAWQGVSCAEVDGRNAIVLVSITVTAFGLEQGKSAGEALAARLRARHPEGDACIEPFTTPSGDPAVSVRRVVTQRVGGRDVTTGQAQALVAYPGAGALGVVSGVALDPEDLDRAAELVTEIAAGMTVTGASAAA
jgi:hypothetical protein